MHRSVRVAACAAVWALASAWGPPSYNIGVSVPLMGWKAPNELEADGFVAATTMFADAWMVGGPPLWPGVQGI